jgi:hypothetical protein
MASKSWARASELQRTLKNNAAPHFKKGTVAVRNKQLQLRQMLSDPKVFLRVLKKKRKKKAKRVGKQKGGNLEASRKPINKLPTVYQYYQ